MYFFQKTFLQEKMIERIAESFAIRYFCYFAF